MRLHKFIRALLCCAMALVMAVGTMPVFAAERLSPDDGIAEISNSERFGYGYVTPGEVATCELRAMGILPPNVDEDSVSDLIQQARGVLTWNDFANLFYDAFGQAFRIPHRIISGVPDDMQRQIGWLKDVGVNVSDYGDNAVSWDTLKSAYAVIGGKDMALPYGLSLSTNPTYGDAGLMVLSLARECEESFFCSHEPMQIPFPDDLRLTPRDYDEAISLFDRCIELVARSVTIDTRNMSAEDGRKLYEELYDRMYSGMSGDYDRRFRYDSECTSVSLRANFDGLSSDAAAYEEFKALDADLRERQKSGELNGYQQDYLLNEWRADHGIRMFELSLNLHYTDAYEVLRDSDKMFYLFDDHEFGDRMMARYDKEFGAFSGTEQEYVRLVRDYICRTARYNWTDFYAGSIPVRSHGIDGYDMEGVIVCDGYADVFAYFMLCRGIPCVNVIGSSVSKAKAEAGDTDHCWSKVFVNGKWYNMDICWDDTSGWYSWDFATDRNFSNRDHWAAGGYYNSGYYAAE